MSKKKKSKDKKKDNKIKDESNINNNNNNDKSSEIERLKLENNNLIESLKNEKNKYNDIIIKSNKFKLNFIKKIENQEEIILYLEKKINDINILNESLQNKLKNDNENNIKLINKINKENNELNENNKNIILKLKNEIIILNKNLKEISDFKINKELIESEIIKMKQGLIKEKKDRFNREAYLERRFLLERERLKKEMLKKIKETKLRLLSMTEDQLHTTTKRTMLENQQMIIELQYQSKETEKLIKLNYKKDQQSIKLKREIQLYKKTQKMLATRTYFLQKLIQQLQLQLQSKNNNNNNNTNYSSHKSIIMNKDNNIDINKILNYMDDKELININKIKKLFKLYEKNQIKLLNIENKKLKQKNKNLLFELKNSHIAYQRFLNLHDETNKFLMDSFDDIKYQYYLNKKSNNTNTTITPKTGNSMETNNTLNIQERAYILEKLLQRLNNTSNNNDTINDYSIYKTPSEQVLTKLDKNKM